MGDYDDDERPSWREIDKRRDRSSHVGSPQKKEHREAREDRWKAGRQKDALDRLFMGDKGTIEHGKLYNNIHKTYGTDRFAGAIQKYLDKFGPPDDVSTLLLLLDSKESSVIFLVIDKLRGIYSQVGRREREDARRKLSMLALTSKSDEIKERASDLADEIKTSL